MLMGNLAADVEFRQTKGGHNLAVFPLATNRVYKNAKEEVESIADFHRIVAWGGLGEICDKYLAKGAAVLVEGRIVNRSFEDADGKKQFKTEIIANEIYILTWKKSKLGKNEIGVESIKSEEVDDVEIPDNKKSEDLAVAA